MENKANEQILTAKLSQLVCSFLSLTFSIFNGFHKIRYLVKAGSKPCINTATDLLTYLLSESTMLCAGLSESTMRRSKYDAEFRILRTLLNISFIGISDGSRGRVRP